MYRRWQHTHREDVYFIVWRLGHVVTVNKATSCTHHYLFLFLSQSEFPEKRGPNSEGTVQKHESRWNPRRVFQVPADHVTHSLGGMQPIVNRAGAKAPESPAQGGGGGVEGGWGQHTWPPSKPDHPVPPVLSAETSVAPIQTGSKVICAPRVGRWFHQAVAGWNGRDLCSRLLGTARAHRQKARHHGNQTAGLGAGKIYWEFWKKFPQDTSLILWWLNVWSLSNLSTNEGRRDRQAEDTISFWQPPLYFKPWCWLWWVPVSVSPVNISQAFQT